MRRLRNFGFPATKQSATVTNRSAVANRSAVTATKVVVSKPTFNPVVNATVKEIANNNKISDVQRQKELQKVISKPIPIKDQPKKVIPRPPSFRPAPSPPVATVPPVHRDSQGRPIEPGEDPGIVIDDPMERERYEKEQELKRQEEERLRKIEETRRKDEERRRAEEEKDRQQRPPSKPTPPSTPRPSPSRTSIRLPTAIPRTYSRNMRVSFRAPRLMLPKPTMRKLQPRPTKQKWNAMNPTYPSFMNRVQHGQFTFQNRGRSLARNNAHSHGEIRKLQNQVNKLNADALKTRQDSMRERNALQSKLRDYELSPVMQVRNHAKGIFSVVDDASKFATPSVNGMHGFPSVGEGPSKALAVGFGLLTALFIIGRVE
jgi:hypothetical protein